MATNKKKGPVALIVLDGWGYREEVKDNAIASANTEFFDTLWKTCPHALLEASGLAVGLPEGQMGNSEIGHTTIGAGKAYDTDLVRIEKSITSGEFDRNPVLLDLFGHIKKNKSTLHVMGLTSRGGVHSHIDHLFAFLKLAKKEGMEKVAIHVFTDGRDTAPQSAKEDLIALEKFLDELGIGFIATVSGRFYAMDRDKNWDRLSKVEQALFDCKGNVCTVKPSEFVQDLYSQKQYDEYIEPIVCVDKDGNMCKIEKNDGIFIFNFRPDRARQITSKLLERKDSDNLFLCTMTKFQDEFPCPVVFPPVKIDVTLGSTVADNGMTQAHIAETEKFAHATYFLNGGKEKPYAKEKDILIPSHKDVPTHDLAPEMRAKEITDAAIQSIQEGYDFIFINYANPDMVGHTGNVPAIIKAVETTDRELKRFIHSLLAHNGCAIVTADHGNAELNKDPQTGEVHTSHTLNPVPAILIGLNKEVESKGTIADIAPTILKMLSLKKPEEMTGKSLIKTE